MSKAVGSVFSIFWIDSVGEALGLQRGVVDAGRLAERAMADRIDFDLADLRLDVARARSASGTARLMIFQ